MQLRAQSWVAGIGQALRGARWALAAGLLLLYLPTIATLERGAWRTPTYSHGPLVLALVGWLLAVRWRQARRELPFDAPRPGLALACLVPGLLMHLAGRAADLPLLEVASLLPVLSAVLLLLGGPATWRRASFAIGFALFLVPWPGPVIDALTQPFKLGVSVLAEALLHALGYPVARAGVTLDIGPYQLLVADACAGLNSLFMLEACGLLYLQLVRHASWLRNLGLALLIVPVSFAANVLRVLLLSLVTFHFGDAAGQGLVHRHAGLLLFVTGLLLVIGLDAGLRRLPVRSTASRHRVAAPVLPSCLHTTPSPAPALVAAAAGLVLAVGCAGWAAAAMPRRSAPPLPATLDALIPARFGAWEQWGAAPMVDPRIAEAGDTDRDHPYDDVLMRSYRHRDGTVVMLALAYGREQRQEVKVHRPELCYAAQGYAVLARAAVRWGWREGRQLEAVRLLAARPGGGSAEAVSYWIRIGERVEHGAWATRAYLMREHLAGRVPDGMLVRASTMVPSARQMHEGAAVNEAFLRELVEALDEATRARLLPAAKMAD